MVPFSGVAGTGTSTTAGASPGMSRAATRNSQSSSPQFSKNRIFLVQAAGGGLLMVASVGGMHW
jgi:hypothetical protein